MTTSVTTVMTSAYDEALANELTAAYEQAKHNYHLGGHRLSAVEGGRFCESAYRLLQSITTGSFTPLNGILNTEKVASALANLPASGFDKSIRLHIPRALRVVYDIRNSRDVAHLADGIDPNLQDATLVVSVLDWVLAEFVRLSGKATADEAQRLVEGLVTRQVPVIQVFSGVPKVLRTNLRAGEHVLVLLYHVGSTGVVESTLRQWLPTTMHSNLRRTLRSLEEKTLLHREGERVFITRSGQRAVEAEGLLGPSDA